MPDLTPDQQAAIQADMSKVNQEFLTWMETDRVLVPIPISAFADFLWARCKEDMENLSRAQDLEGIEHAPIGALINALSFGMHLGKMGYDEDSFTHVFNTELSEEDEKRLLGEDSGGTAGTAL
jgi:hypothetical protein